jgi:hypothetical protein
LDGFFDASLRSLGPLFGQRQIRIGPLFRGCDLHLRETGKPMLGQIDSPSREQILQFPHAKHARLIGGGRGEQLDPLEGFGPFAVGREDVRDFAQDHDRALRRALPLEPQFRRIRGERSERNHND